MPNIDKLKKKKKDHSLPKNHLPVVAKTTKKTNLPAKTIKSTHDYYCCCAEKTKQGIPKGTKITQLTAHCKQNATKLSLAKQKVREQEKKKIISN
jgi:hypothetical protein